MVIDKYFIHYKKPGQYLYWGENYLDFFAVPTTEKHTKKIKSFEGVSLAQATPEAFQEIAREIPAVETGVFLNSSQFIFNIFEFEKVPFQEKLKRELVEWRLKKVFPENIDDYEHHFYQLTRNRVISVLFKKIVKEKIQELFENNRIPLIHIGNTTIEVINYMAKQKNKAPDCFIQIDKGLALAVFLQLGLPYYIRKFRFDQVEDLTAEIEKTVNYVKNSYNKTPASLSVITDRTHSSLDFNYLNDKLATHQIQSMELKEREQILFPGKKQ